MSMPCSLIQNMNEYPVVQGRDRKSSPEHPPSQQPPLLIKLTYDSRLAVRANEVNRELLLIRVSTTTTSSNSRLETEDTIPSLFFISTSVFVPAVRVK